MKRRAPLRHPVATLGSLLVTAALVLVPATAGAATSSAGPAPQPAAAAADCSSAPAWDADTAYNGGDTVTYEGHLWEANWWTRGQEPGSGGEWGPWADRGPCDGDDGDDSEPPTVPSNPRVTGTSSSSVSLAWDASSDNVGVSDYVVYEGGEQARVTSDTAATVSGLSPSTSYTFTVAARDEAGNTSEPSDAVTAETEADDGGGDPGAYVKAGYYMQWSTYDRDYQVKDLMTSGAAEQLTHINYAFINVEDGDGDGDYECTSGDPYADYTQSMGAADSVDGEGDTWDQSLRGNFNQLAELKQEYPHLEVYASLGGWTWSQHFSDAAATEASRENLVSSCVDMLLKGNLPERSNAGGEGVASEVFDGIDLDWEWPASEGHPDNDPRPEDKGNYTLLLQEFREQMDAYEGQTGEEYGLSAFLPASKAKIEAGFEVEGVFDILDFANIQGYDLHGAWDSQTNHQSQIFSPPDDPAPEDQRFSVNKAINAYLERGAPAGKMTIGIPFYGRGWTGVSEGGTDGLYQDSSGAAPGEFPDSDGIGSYEWLVTTKNLDITHDEEAMAASGYGGSEFWTFDTPQVIGDKMQWVEDNGLLGAMIWPMSGDTPDGTLMTAIDDGLG